MSLSPPHNTVAKIGTDVSKYVNIPSSCGFCPRGQLGTSVWREKSKSRRKREGRWSPRILPWCLVQEKWSPCPSTVLSGHVFLILNKIELWKLWSQTQIMIEWNLSVTKWSLLSDMQFGWQTRKFLEHFSKTDPLFRLKDSSLLK